MFVILTLVLLLGLSIAGTGLFGNLRTSYYVWRMHAAWHAATNLPPSVQQGEALRQLDSYRDELERIGYLEKRVIPLRWIKPGSPESRKLLELATKELSMSIHVHFLLQRNEAMESAAILIWDKPGRVDEIEIWVNKYDQSNFWDIVPGPARGPSTVGSE